MTNRGTFTLRNVAGDSYAFSGPSYVMEHDGLGLVKPRRAVRSGPQQHGQSLSQALLEPRVVSLKLHLQCSSETQLGIERDMISKMLSQVNTPIYLDVGLPDGTTRRLDVHYYDGMTSPRTAGDPDYSATDVLQLIADDPIAYDPTPYVLRFDITGGGSAFLIPTPVPVLIGAAEINENFIVHYYGTWASYPIIRVTGPIDDLVIYNDSTNEKLDFTGTDISDGEYLEIDLRYGYKTVTDNLAADRTDALTIDSDLATFHLAPHPEVDSGSNDMRVTGDNITGATMVTITYYVRYWSVL
jgi:hypothetical protein